MKYVYLVFCLFILGCGSTKVVITDGEMAQGQECFRITTPSATYLYQKEAGGFSNIIDSSGTDWVQFKKSDKEEFPASAAADYRGVPNLVFRSDDGGCGHPGFDKMTSKQIGDNKIQSTSKSGKWQWTWTFYPKYAELEVQKVDPKHKYWFLYEGPIAGKFSPKSHYWGTDVSGPNNSLPDLIKGNEIYKNWQSVYFGDQNTNKVFFVHQEQEDNLEDLYTYMGNDKTLTNSSPDGMVVFGFGRTKRATPLMTALQKFRIGFVDAKVTSAETHQTIINKIKTIHHD